MVKQGPVRVKPVTWVVQVTHPSGAATSHQFPSLYRMAQGYAMIAPSVGCEVLISLNGQPVIRESITADNVDSPLVPSPKHVVR